MRLLILVSCRCLTHESLNWWLQAQRKSISTIGDKTPNIVAAIMTRIRSSSGIGMSLSALPTSSGWDCYNLSPARVPFPSMDSPICEAPLDRDDFASRSGENQIHCHVRIRALTGKLSSSFELWGWTKDEENFNLNLTVSHHDRLDLPNYPTPDILYEKLLMAVEETSGFLIE